MLVLHDSPKEVNTIIGTRITYKVDSGSKLIDEFEVTPANEYDSQVIVQMIDQTDIGQPLWADSAYASKKFVEP